MSSVVVHVAAPQDVEEEGSSSSVDSLNSDDMYEIYFDKLKKNDPTITAFTAKFGPDCLANSIDWEEDGDVSINIIIHTSNNYEFMFGNQTVF